MAYSQKAVNKYRAKNYWNMSVTVPKEYKETIQAAAEARGVSVSRFVTDLIGKELGMDLSLTGVFPGASGRPAPDGQPDSQEAED